MFMIAGKQLSNSFDGEDIASTLVNSDKVAISKLAMISHTSESKVLLSLVTIQPHNITATP